MEAETEAVVFVCWLPSGCGVLQILGSGGGETFSSNGVHVLAAFRRWSTVDSRVRRMRNVEPQSVPVVIVCWLPSGGETLLIVGLGGGEMFFSQSVPVVIVCWLPSGGKTL